MRMNGETYVRENVDMGFCKSTHREENRKRNAFVVECSATAKDLAMYSWSSDM